MKFIKDTKPCKEKCGRTLCGDYHKKKFLCDARRQCIGCGDHTCHVCIEVMYFMNCWKYSAPICNNDKKSCSEQCHSCDHLWCDKCWWGGVGHHCDCGVSRRCDSCKDYECDHCHINPMLSDEDGDGDGDARPWHGFDFLDNLIDEF
jgi:hypothetical protein